MRHDRTVIEAAGGPWPGVAERVRASVEGILLKPNPQDEQIQRITRLMQARGMNGMQLARLAGCHNSEIYAALRGESARTPAFWARLEAALCP